MTEVMLEPRDPYSELVDENRRMTWQWYSWLREVTFQRPRTFGTLPGPPLEGQEFDITDCNTSVWGATATGGGAVHAKVRYNGTNWTVVGI